MQIKKQRRNMNSFQLVEQKEEFRKQKRNVFGQFIGHKEDKK